MFVAVFDLKGFCLTKRIALVGIKITEANAIRLFGQKLWLKFAEFYADGLRIIEHYKTGSIPTISNHYVRNTRMNRVRIQIEPLTFRFCEYNFSDRRPKKWFWIFYEIFHKWNSHVKWHSMDSVLFWVENATFFRLCTTLNVKIYREINVETENERMKKVTPTPDWMMHTKMFVTFGCNCFCGCVCAYAMSIWKLIEQNILPVTVVHL